VAQPAIIVEDLTKRYRIGRRRPVSDDRWSSLRRLLRLRQAGRPNEPGDDDRFIWALKQVSFNIQPGEVVGIIGRNGSGKSTLLKILSRVVTPTAGRAVVHGRLGSLLEVGIGFHPELTGRENIYLNGAILGMSRAEVRRKFDEIVAFAEIERFLDTPVKRYSSGMYVRLAFAVAAHLDPDILIVDEVLAVGDIEFQNKCLGKMDGVARSGRTILFVSHNLHAVAALTTRTLLLCDGRIVFDGPTGDALAEYLRMRNVSQPVYIGTVSATEPRVLRVALHTSHAHHVQMHGHPLRIEIDVHTPHPLRNAGLAVQICNSSQEPVAYVGTFDGEQPLCRAPGTYRLVCRVPALRLYMGRYTLRVRFGRAEPLEGLCPFEVVMGRRRSDRDWSPGVCAYLEDGEWEVTPLEPASLVANCP